MMQIIDMGKEEKIPALLRLGFRPFFLFGCVFAIVSILLWLLFYRGVFTFSPYGNGHWWHMHEMVFGFGIAIVAGFLLTAVQNWTGITGLKGKPLAFLFVLWLAGRIVMFAPDLLGTTASAIIDLSFLPIFAFFLARPIIAVKQMRNLFFVPMLLVFMVINIMFHMSLTDHSISMFGAGHAAVLLITLLMSIMAGRVVPMFTANGTKTQKVLPVKALEITTNASLAILTLQFIAHPFYIADTYFFVTFYTLAGVTQAIRWFRWKPWITVKVPLLWSLHISLMFIWLSLLLLAVSALVPAVTAQHVWHMLTIGGMGGLILAMISRVSLGHTGRMLTPPKLMSVAYVCLFIAALVRSVLPIILPEKTVVAVDASGTFWVIGFLIFVILYGPMLCSARADGRPG